MTNQEWIQSLSTKDLALFLHCVRNSEIIPTSWSVWLKTEHKEED